MSALYLSRTYKPNRVILANAGTWPSKSNESGLSARIESKAAAIHSAPIRPRNGASVKRAPTADRLDDDPKIRGILNVLVSKPLTQLPGASIGRRERRAVTMHGFAVRQDGSAAAVRLTDVSNDGCGLETTAELKPNERIELSVPGHGAIAATVRWCANGRAGVTFDAVPTAQKRLSRGSKRHSLATEVSLRRTGRPLFRVRVLDISSTGCRLDVVDRPEVDERVWIRFEGLEAIESTVCWVAGFKVGLKYSNPIHPAVFDQLLKRFSPGAADC